MERKQGGCCLAPRFGGATTGQEAWQMGNIMLKFRPIAPKPAAMAPAPMTPPVTTAAALGAAGKGKRKAAAGGRGRRGRKPKKATTTTTLAVVTAAEPATQKVDRRKDKPPLSSPSSSSSGTTSVDSSTPPPPPPAKESFPAMPPRADLAPAHVLLRPVASCVTIESVTATWHECEAPSAAASCGGVDEAPAFVSDQWGRVTWMNMAFSRAASAGDAATAPPGPASDAGVVLAAKDGAAVPAWGTCAGFTCRVRVTYDACPRRGSLVAPCDVWRLDAGCYLWRLDLQATLTLSLGGLL